MITNNGPITRRDLAPLPDDEPRRNQPKQEMRVMLKRSITRSVTQQANAAIAADRMDRRFLAALRTSMRKLAQSLRITPVPTVSCICSCLIGGKREDDSHFTTTFGDYTYTLCASCIQKSGYIADDGNPVYAHYYYCSTDAPVGSLPAYHEAVCAGEVEAYRACQEARDRALWSGSDGRELRVAGADDQARKGNVPSGVVRYTSTLGSGVETRELDCSLRHEAASDSDLPNGGHGGTEGIPPLNIAFCRDCGTSVELQFAKGHVCA